MFSLIMFRQLNESYTKDVIRKSESSIEVEKTNIQNNMETMERAVQIALSDREVMNYIDRSTDPDPAELIEFSSNTMNNLLRLQFNNPDLEHIRIFSDNLLISEIWPVFLKESRMANEPWYDEVLRLNGGALWEISERDKEPIQNHIRDEKEFRQKMSLLREIEYPKGKHVGIIQVDMLLSRFSPALTPGIATGSRKCSSSPRAAGCITIRPVPCFPPPSLPPQGLRRSFPPRNMPGPTATST
ncbi:hypothetical protein VQ056_18095 [Paenibacillus sp. JTLBN-2024]